LEPAAALAAIAATKSVPIVMRSTVDPVAAGFITSLARPGGNVTGVTSESSESLFRKFLIRLQWF